ncbi:MAG: hypothetical protein CME06_15630 [Gemmatimonadetes bacterium]|nr:hypothetical protein [Gemmatimonadota bacterium]
MIGDVAQSQLSRCGQIEGTIETLLDRLHEDRRQVVHIDELKGCGRRARIRDPRLAEQRRQIIVHSRTDDGGRASDEEA